VSGTCEGTQRVAKPFTPAPQPTCQPGYLQLDRALAKVRAPTDPGSAARRPLADVRSRGTSTISNVVTCIRHPVWQPVSDIQARTETNAKAPPRAPSLVAMAGKPASQADTPMAPTPSAGLGVSRDIEGYPDRGLPWLSVTTKIDRVTS
jgi:hypothetical protein